MICVKGHLISEQICEDIDFPNCNKNIARFSTQVHKHFQGRNPSNIFVAILENQFLLKFVLRLSDLIVCKNENIKSYQ